MPKKELKYPIRIFRTIERMRAWSRSEQERINALRNLRVFISWLGYPIIIRRCATKEGRRTERIVYKNIEKAISGQEKIFARYLRSDLGPSELKRVSTDINGLTNVRGLLLNWMRMDEALKKEANKILEDAARDLQASRDLFKTDAWQRINSMDQFLDCLERENPGASAAKATAALARLKKRKIRINRNALFAMKRKIVLINEQQAMEINLLQSYHRINTLVVGLGLFLENKDRLLKEESKKILYLLRSAWLLPYSHPAEKCSKLIRHVLIKKKYILENLQKASAMLRTTIETKQTKNP